MTVAASVLLIAIGAILYFATNLHVAHVEIDTVGLILMIAGLAGLILGLILEGTRWRPSQREAHAARRRSWRPPPR
jgi:uncharacterized membrane protein YwaF